MNVEDDQSFDISTISSVSTLKNDSIVNTWSLSEEQNEEWKQTDYDLQYYHNYQQKWIQKHIVDDNKYLPE